MSYIFELLDAKNKRSAFVSSRSIRRKSWNYITATYDYKTGIATLWNNAKVIARKNIGRFNSGLATNYAVVVGAKTSRSSLFPVDVLHACKYSVDR